MVVVISRLQDIACQLAIHFPCDLGEQSLWPVPSLELRHKSLVRLMNGDAMRAYILWAGFCFTMAACRDILQPSSSMLQSPAFTVCASLLWIFGNVLHYYSMYVLGWRYVYHGDCFFGPQKTFISAFPYGSIPSPMYNGKAISYLGSALWTGKPAGLALALWTFLVLNVTGAYEDTITHQMYKVQIEEARRKKD
ncbi:hypothetical protein PRZ48_002215 [Zasmidium cellare]|uniref:phosphatidyl-N-methylethanolamine N-methyltransferase n=1 Tax=Zasmidium cellare TaxID=395010 RepID=A0ABR0F5E8_ZASCE|nr:hypothetical protein PRZ48_002215 [Zasmidium cellare]